MKRRHGLRMAAIAVAGVTILAACSKSSTSAQSPSAALPSVTIPTTSTGPGANPGSAFCTQLRAEKDKFSELGSTLGQAIASNNLATVKQGMATYFTAIAQTLAQAEASMGSAPADVQAALTTVNQYFAGLQSTIANATSLQQLTEMMGRFTSTPELKSAAQTLDAYTKAQCGDITSPTP